MPDLLSDGWSDSDSSQDARDVEMGIVPSDLDEDWTDEGEEMIELPSAAPVDPAQTPDRRARVEDEAEPLPSQPIPAHNPAPSPRMYTGAGGAQPFIFVPTATQHGHGTPTIPRPQPSQPPLPGNNTIPQNAQRDARGHLIHAPLFFMGMGGSNRPTHILQNPFFRQFDLATAQTQTPQPGQLPNQPGGTHGEPRQPGDTGQAPTLVYLPFAGPGPLPPFFAAPGPGPQPPASDGPGEGGGPGFGHGPWADILHVMFEPPEEKEDPQRAMKLVEGLERVPVGLVERMARIGGVPGAHEDSTGTDGEEPGCAICWDSLLPEERSGDATLKFDTPVKFEHPTEAPDSEPAPGGHTSNTIISLPCSHVFHASCLIPWFSKPRHTTCPTCRFDVDPSNLTYTPPQWRPHPPPAQPVPNPMATPANAPPHGDLLPLDPLSDNRERDHQPAHAPVDPPLPTPGFLAAQPPPSHLPGGAQNDGLHDRHNIFQISESPQPQVFGPPPPPGHPTHGTGAAAANTPRDHGDEPRPIPFPDFHRGGGPVMAVDFTINLNIPSGEAPDQERIGQFLQQFLAANVLGTPQQAGPAPNPGGAHHEPDAPIEWVPPPAPGPTLRQRVESKERKAGLRCDDPSCGIGPSDEVPFPEVFHNPNSPSIKRVPILKTGDNGVCGHVFHPACLVRADRCSGWGEEDRPSKEGNGEYEVVSCPVCRSVGKVEKQVWEEGANELRN